MKVVKLCLGPCDCISFNGRLAAAWCIFISMEFQIRNAGKKDCAVILDLVRELAKFERAPDAVTVSLQEFEACGFGDKPVWWGFVAVAGKEELTLSRAKMTTQDVVVSQILGENSSEVIVDSDDPCLLNQMEDYSLEMEEERSMTEEAPAPFAVIAPSTQTQSAPIEEEIVGFALYYIRYSTWKGRRMYLEDIYVQENWRGKGVGTALMDALLGRAKTEGFKGITWQVLDWNEEAIQFYKRYNATFDAGWENVSVEL